MTDISPVPAATPVEIDLPPFLAPVPASKRSPTVSFKVPVFVWPELVPPVVLVGLGLATPMSVPFGVAMAAFVTGLVFGKVYTHWIYRRTMLASISE